MGGISPFANMLQTGLDGPDLPTEMCMSERLRILILGFPSPLAGTVLQGNNGGPVWSRFSSFFFLSLRSSEAAQPTEH